ARSPPPRSRAARSGSAPAGSSRHLHRRACGPWTACSCARCGQTGRRLEIDPAPGGIDGPHDDVDRVPEPYLAAGVAPDERRRLLVEVIPVTADPAGGKEAF